MKLTMDIHGPKQIDLTYVDLLTALHDDVRKDALMPDNVKKQALRQVEKLQRTLWPYSA